MKVARVDIVSMLILASNLDRDSYWNTYWKLVLGVRSYLLAVADKAISSERSSN